MIIKRYVEGTLAGCCLMKNIWKDLPDADKEFFRSYIEKYPRMYPCPDSKFWFVVKEDTCRYCRHVIVKN